MIIVKKAEIINAYRSACKKNNAINYHLIRDNFDFANDPKEYSQADISDLFTIALLQAKYISFPEYLKACNNDKKVIEKLVNYCKSFDVTMRNKTTIDEVAKRYKRHIIGDKLNRLEARLLKLNVNISNLM